MPRRATAFAPAAITNFFQIHYGRSGLPDGATGGGYVLSRGTVSTATFEPSELSSVAVVVDGDPTYDARTTRLAVQLLARGSPGISGKILLEQTVGTPIGSGFGSSAASAVSGVYAAAAAMGVRREKRDLATYAHNAEITERTGLGTVSVVYDAVGAGAILVPGEPGVAQFRTVRVPKDMRIVTAFLAPYDKKDALGSKSISEKVNRLGKAALESFLRDPTLESLAAEGEKFSGSLGLETQEVKKLLAVAKAHGAMFASQNMIGYAVHALTDVDGAGKILAAWHQAAEGARTDLFRVGKSPARVRMLSRR